jgi:uncharacterized protein
MFMAAEQGDVKMQGFGGFVVRHHKAIMALYIVLLIPSLFGYLLTDINYDQLAYMPTHMNSRQGEELLQDTFRLSGLGLVLASNKEPWEQELLANNLNNISGVKEVVWWGSIEDTLIPTYRLDEMIRDNFIREDYSLFQIRFEGTARSEKTNRAVGEIYRLIESDPDLMLGGEPAIIRDMRAITRQEMILYMAIAVIMILIILNLSVSSYVDPLIFLASVGVAVALNMGSNFIQGEISFLTSSIASVMQFGIALDYSIFLLHRYEEEKKKMVQSGEAMAITINNTFVAIASSGLTTIGGFAALTVMQNGMGRDLGLVLGKGILISLLVNLTLLPSLLLIFHRASDRFQHRVLLPSFRKLSYQIIRSRWAYFVIFLLLLVPGFLAQNKIDFYYSSQNYLPNNAPSVVATGEIAEIFGVTELQYVIVPDQGRVAEAELVRELKGIEGVRSVVSITEQVDMAIPDLMIPDDVLDEFRAGGYRYLMVFLDKFALEEDAFVVVDEIRAAGAGYDEYYVTGATALTRDMASLVLSDANRVAIVSVICIALIIAISFRSISLPILLIIAIQLAIYINMSFAYFSGQRLSSLTPMIIGAIQLGATVDYAILFTMRYRENLGKWRGRIEALRHTIDDAGRSILTSALTLFAATFGISVVASIRTTREMTLLIGRGALISMVVIFLWLPALLLLSDRIIQKTTSHWPPEPQRKVYRQELFSNEGQKGGISDE